MGDNDRSRGLAVGEERKERKEKGPRRVCFLLFVFFYFISYHLDIFTIKYAT